MAKLSGSSTRRTVLLGTCLALLTAGTQCAPGRAAGSDGARQEIEEFLALLAAEGTAPYLLRPALSRLEKALPATLAAEISQRAEAAGVSTRDYLAYSAAESLPISATLFSRYIPEVLSFIVKRSERQKGMTGAAFFPGSWNGTWREEGFLYGLAVDERPGVYFGVNSGVTALTLMPVNTPWLGPGVSPPLATRLMLDTGRSLNGALAALRETTPSRFARYLVYDWVENIGELVEFGQDWHSQPVRTPLQVLSSSVDNASENSARLRAALEANLGWLTLGKALRLLMGAVPESIYVVISPDDRQGRFVDSGGVEHELRF